MVFFFLKKAPKLCFRPPKSGLNPAWHTLSAQQCWEFLNCSSCTNQDSNQGCSPPPTMEPNIPYPFCTYKKVCGGRYGTAARSMLAQPSKVPGTHLSLPPERRLLCKNVSESSGSQCPAWHAGGLQGHRKKLSWAQVFPLLISLFIWWTKMSVARWS